MKCLIILYNRNELEEKKSQIEKLTHKLEWSLQSQGNRERPKSAEADHNISNHQSFQNERLELECIDLKDRLSKALKTVHLLQISKKKVCKANKQHLEKNLHFYITIIVNVLLILAIKSVFKTPRRDFGTT